MGRKATLKEAAKILGPPFTETELRRGALTGKYPAMRAGGPRGKLIFDLELLESKIEELMLSNVKEKEVEESTVLFRRVR